MPIRRLLTSSLMLCALPLGYYTEAEAATAAVPASRLFYQMAVNTSKNIETYSAGQDEFSARRSPEAIHIAANVPAVRALFAAPLKEAMGLFREVIAKDTSPVHDADRDKLFAERAIEFFSHLTVVAIYAHALEMSPAEVDANGNRPQESRFLARSLALASRSFAQSLIGSLSYTDTDRANDSFETLLVKLTPSLSKLVPQERSREIFLSNLAFARAHSSDDGVSHKEAVARLKWLAHSNIFTTTKQSLKLRFSNRRIRLAMSALAPEPIYPQPIDMTAIALEGPAINPASLKLPLRLEFSPRISSCESLFGNI